MKNPLTILITGASGFVGTHLLEHALEHNYRVYALVRKNSVFEKHPQVNYLYGDITKYQSLIAIFETLKKKQVQLDCIIHAAALTKSNSKKKLEEVNYTGTCNLYKSLEELNYIPGKIILISSLAAAGPEKGNTSVSVTHARPVTTYGKSKLKAEAYALQSPSINTTIIRPTAVYGPGDKDLYSVFRLINKSFNPILGTHRQQLTFIYVKDLVGIIFSAITNGKQNAVYFATDGQVYDKYALPREIGTSLNKKALKIVFPLFVVKTLAFFSQQVGGLTGKTSSLNIEKYRELIAESWVCDVQNTFEELKYIPAYTLREGVEETAAWYKKNKWI